MSWKIPPEFALETREEGLSAGFPGECVASGCRPAGSRLLDGPCGSIMMRRACIRPMAIDGHAASWMRFARLVEGQLAEGVDARGKQHDRLPPLDVCIRSSVSTTASNRLASCPGWQPLQGFVGLASDRW